MTDLDKAREWANGIRNASDNGHPIDADCYSAAEVIQSLPDHWVDAEKLREIIEEMETPKNKPIEIGYDLGVVVATEAWRIQLQALLPPKLPTLADMTQEERKARQWMQSRLEGSTSNFVIADPGRMESRLWTKDGAALIVDNNLITPLPDLPKLEWPGGVVDCEIVDGSLDDQAVAKDVCNSESNSSETPKSSIKPEDVPPNEPWLIEVADGKAIGTRYQDDTDVPWSVATLDGSFAGDHNDREVTLIHKLVPETHALPEGMRLADHAKFGRVVTSPWGDGDDDYKIFFLNEDARGGADYDFAHESELTFLDGDQHV